MANLSSLEKAKLEQLLGMESGYVLGFSNRKFQEFVFDNTGIDIFIPKYCYASGSKANRLRAFWNLEENHIVGKLISSLLEYWKWQKSSKNLLITYAEQLLFDECLRIAERLEGKSSDSKQEDGKSEKDKKQIIKDKRLSELLLRFDELAVSSDCQRRGYILQELLNELFLINDISIRSSFQRNSGGEQIDGAFYFQSWHYLVECKWTKKLSDIRELDSLLGKVNRSGKQTMGLFLSIDGWSINVPSLLKQNVEKCIILMDGYDLRCVLSGAIELENLLLSKISKLNLEGNPIYSAAEILREK